MKSLADELKLAAMLVPALVWCGILITFRTLWTRNIDYTFLFWNLALAAAPLFFSILVLLQRRFSLQLLFGCLWLLFLPNAPYVFTDLLHLRELESGPLWLDVLMLSSCAATALSLGYASMHQIHALFIAAHRPVLGWTIAVSGMFLCGFGIYLGRFLRWRSIDIFQNPASIFFDILERLTNPLVHYRAWGVTLGFGCMLILGYCILTYWTHPTHFSRSASQPRPRN